jgi:hypothetical protein
VKGYENFDPGGHHCDGSESAEAHYGRVVNVEKAKIYIAVPADRDAVVTVLARNGYTVRQSREKCGKAYKYFVEYFREEEG